MKVLDYVRATSLIGQTTLRSILGQSDLDHLLSERDKINAELQQVIGPWLDEADLQTKCQNLRELFESDFPDLQRHSSDHNHRPTRQ